MLTSRTYKLNRERTIALLRDLDKSDAKAISLYLPAGTSISGIETILSQISSAKSIPDTVAKLAGVSATGAVVFWGESAKYLLLPPFPIAEKYISGGFDAEPFVSLLGQDYNVGIVLVRRGTYSLGICHGEKIIDHFSGTGLVHGRHRQGGSSAARFQRRRKDQTHHFLERVCEHIREKFLPYAGKLDFLVCGGARTTILQLQKQCPFLKQFEDRLLPQLLEIQDPKFSVLEKAVTDIWSSKVMEWRETNVDSSDSES